MPHRNRWLGGLYEFELAPGLPREFGHSVRTVSEVGQVVLDVFLRIVRSHPLSRFLTAQANHRPNNLNQQHQ